MKKIIRILFVCLFFIALIFIGKNLLKDGKEREYIKSDKYYEENIENININEVNGASISLAVRNTLDVST